MVKIVEAFVNTIGGRKISTAPEGLVGTLSAVQVFPPTTPDVSTLIGTLNEPVIYKAASCEPRPSDGKNLSGFTLFPKLAKKHAAAKKDSGPVIF